MENDILNQSTKRRGFLGLLAGGATLLGLSAITAPFKVNAQDKPKPAKAGTDPADAWFNKVKGTHRVVYDSTQPHEIFPFAWPRVFLLTNAATGSPESDCGVVVVLRHTAIGYAMKDKMWEKYGLAELFKAQDPGPAWQIPDRDAATKTRNPFWNAKPTDFAIPGFGAVDIGINSLQNSGVMFCVCNAALTVFSTVVAGQRNMKPEEVYNEWKEELIPGIQIVPSGVWAVGRAQEHGCRYTFAG